MPLVGRRLSVTRKAKREAKQSIEDVDEVGRTSKGQVRKSDGIISRTRSRRSVSFESSEHDSIEIPETKMSEAGRRWLEYRQQKPAENQEEDLDYALEDDEGTALSTVEEDFEDIEMSGIDGLIQPRLLTVVENADLGMDFEEPELGGFSTATSSSMGFCGSDRSDSGPKSSAVAGHPLCHLAYLELPGYPDIRTTYSFLRCAGKPVIPDFHNHQLLHMCHNGTELELLKRIQRLVSIEFDFKKAVIFARRDERLRDIQRALKLCSLDSYRIRMGTTVPKMMRIFDNFEKTKKRIVVCSCRVLPPSRALVNANLLIWWNIPWSASDFLKIKSRLSARTLILVVIKQEGDWNFLYRRKEDQGIIFRELDLDCDDIKAGFLNTRFDQRNQD